MRLPRASTATVAVVAAAAAAVALRIWVLASPLGALDSDEAVKGLMARHALDGELSVFFWLQAYGGAQDAWLAALVFALVGSSTLALKLTHLALWAAAALLLWRLAARTIGEPAARLAAAVFVLWPPYLVWYSTKAFSVFAVPATLAALLFFVRFLDRRSTVDALAFGLCAGLAWWALAERTLVLLAPFLAWALWSRRRSLAGIWPAVPAFAVAAAPWFAWNVRYDWLSLRAQPAEGIGEPLAERVGALFTTVAPTWLGLRVPGSLDWLVPPALAAVVVALAFAGVAWLARRPPPGLAPFVVAVAVFPAYALSPFTAYVREPRYVVPLAPAIAALVGWASSRRSAYVVVLPLLALVSGVGIAAMERQRFGAAQPPSVDAAVRVLENAGATRVLADYWLAYRITFESEERVVATSTGFVRYVPHDRLVRAAPRPARVYVAGSRGERTARPLLERAGFRRVVADELAVYLP